MSRLFALAAVLLMSCSTLKVNHSAVSEVKKFAVFGYTTRVEVEDAWAKKPEQPTGKVQIRTMQVEFDYNGLSRLLPPEKLAEEVGDALKKELKWEVKTVPTVVKNGGYQKWYTQNKSHRGRWFGSMGSGPKYDYVDGMMSSYDAQRTNLSQRKKVMTDLGVDAVAHVDVEIRLYASSNLSLGKLRLGSYEPKVTIRMKVYNAKSNEPIWAESNAKGSGEAARHLVGVADRDKLRQGAMMGVREAVKDMVKRFRDNQKAAKS